MMPQGNRVIRLGAPSGREPELRPPNAEQTDRTKRLQAHDSERAVGTANDAKDAERKELVTGNQITLMVNDYLCRTASLSACSAYSAVLTAAFRMIL
jgi:hypothetical protein